MKTIHLLRHAKTEQGGPAVSDRERALTARGEADARALGRWLMQTGALFDRVLTSPSKRTVQTLDMINQAYQPPLAGEPVEALYLASCGELIHQLQQLPDAVGSVLVVGHNPGMHLCCLSLAGDGAPEAMEAVELSYATCALSQLSAEVADWAAIAPGCAYLQYYINRHQVAADLGISPA